MDNLINLFTEHSAGTIVSICVIIGTFVEIAPIKISPLEWIGTRLMKGFTRSMKAEVLEVREQQRSMMTKIDEMQEAIVSLRRRQEEEAMNTARNRIIRFDDEAMHDVAHTKDMFEQVLNDIDTYESYCEAHPEFKNNKGNTARERIKEAYHDKAWI